MTSFFSLVKWLFKAALFFTLFAFALNNQADATVRFFFGYQWSAPMVIVVLLSFCAGLLVGILGMVPRWWQQRRAAKAKAASAPSPAASSPGDSAMPHEI